MTSLKVILEGDGCWTDLQDLMAQGKVEQALSIEVAFLPGGMSSGKAAITVRFNMPDGRVVIAETSHALFEGASQAFRGRVAYLDDLKKRSSGDA